MACVSVDAWIGQGTFGSTTRTGRTTCPTPAPTGPAATVAPFRWALTNNWFTAPGKIAYAQCLSTKDLMVFTRR
jgi:hypothetical protein